MRDSSASRLNSVDALRGLAVLFMMDQHVVSWLCAELGSSGVIQGVSAPGGLAAPIFLVLSGVGASLTACRYEGSDRIFVMRGAGLIGFGYVLNVLAPNWFSIGSWYVLHMIGLGLLLSPLLRRLPSPALGWLMVAILVGTVVIQNSLDTPFRLYNKQMANPELPGGLFRHAVAEGYFPAFPWSAFFVAGLLAGRWLMGGNLKGLRYLTVALFLGSAGLAACYAVGPAFTRSESLVRVFKVVPSFYPSLTPMSLFLMSMALCLLLLFVWIEGRAAFSGSNVLVCLGRSSLTFLIVHVVVIRESAVRFGFWRSFSTLETLSITVAVLAVFSVVAVLWRRIGFRFGAEWLLRQL